MNIIKRITACTVALFIAVSPLQQTLPVFADDKRTDMDLPADEILLNDLQDEDEILSTEEVTIPDCDYLTGTDDVVRPVVEETEETEQSESSLITDDNGDDITENNDMSGIVEASTAEEYFALISVFPDCERIIVDTYEDLSLTGVSYGVYFDGTYILGFESEKELSKAVETITGMGLDYSVDGTLSVCGYRSGLISYGRTDPDAKVRIAVIDTGSNLANESYSVIGDDVSDHNGHGTDMCNSVLGETDNAYIISIKAIGDDGKGNISDVYVAVQMAEEMAADYILMAISVRNTGRYDAFISLIENTKAQIVASAGNNGTDAAKYLPAGTDGVITVGALGKDGTLQPSSNYGSSVEYYVAADSTSEAASKALGIIADGRSDELPTGYIVPSGSGDDPGVDDTGDQADAGQGNEYHLIMRAEEEDVKFVTDNIHDAVITVYQRQIYHQSDYFSHPYNDGFGVYSDSNSGNTFSWDSHILYCIEDTKDIPDDLGYGDRQYYGTGTTDSDMKLIQAACAFGPAGELYDYAVQWWKAHDGNNEILSRVKNDPQLMRRAMYAVTHFVVCKAYEGSWPRSTPGDNDSVPQVFVDYYNYLKSVRNGSITIPGYDLSGWWCELYRCNSFNDQDDNNAFQLMTRGNAVKTPSASAEFRLEKSSSVNVDPGYFGFAGTTYTLYGAFPPATLLHGDYELRDEIMTFVMKDDGTAGTSFKTTVNGTETYYLKETKAAEGYTLDDNIYWIGIASDGSVSAGVMESYVSGSQTRWREITDTGRIKVTGSSVSIVNVKDTPDGALFRLDKKLGSNYSVLAGQTYVFELWDNTADTRVAAGKASVPSGSNGSTVTPVVWSGIAAGFSSGPDNSLMIIPGHKYQVMETTLTVNGADLETPSGWTKGTAHGKTCFYQTFTAGAGKVHELDITNNGISQVKLSLTKASSNTGITGNNSSYSFEGTKYVLSSDESFSTSGTVGSFVMKKDGTAGSSLTVLRGKTYYLKETEAGAGYELDRSVYKIVIASDATATVSTYSGQGKASVTNGDPILINVKDNPKSAQISIVKESSDTSITKGNTCYSFAGTTYGLFQAKADAEAGTGALIRFSMDASGNTDAQFTVSFGKTYYLKELSAGKGYKTDDKIYTVKVASDGTVTVNNGAEITASGNVSKIRVKDEPGTAPLNIVLRKTDKKGNTVHNAGLTGAVFRISYYAMDLGASGNDNAAATVIYDLTLKSDHASLSLSDLRALKPAGGTDAGYLKNLPEGLEGFPYGTVRIQEITAPAGYRLNDQTVRYRLGAKVSYSVENNSSYGNRNYWRQLANGDLELTELPEVGYYELSKSLDDGTVRKELSGFEYQIWNMSSASSPVQIASGVSQADGRVLWTYTVPDYYQNDNPSKLLTGTSAYRIELPATEKNAGGSESAIQYQVREIISSMDITYGDTGIMFTYAAPVTSGKAWSKATSYYYKELTVSDEKITREGVTNDYPYTGISVNKVVPADNPFDITKVSFKVYNTDGGRDTLIANGSVDLRGNVIWHQNMTSGGKTVTVTSLNVLNGLPLGHYRVEEIWKKEYVDAEGIKVLIVEKNNNGWNKTETDSSYVYSCDLDLSSASNDGRIMRLSVENEKEVQEFNLVKEVAVDGDASDITALLYLVDGDSETLVSTGSAKTDGRGTFGFTWDYSGEHQTRDGLDTLVLPAGKYRIAELCPVTYYKDSAIPYTYMTPEGYTERTVEDGIQFYKDFELKAGSYVTETMTVTNVRIEGSFDIIKIEHSGDGLPKSFVFEIYYRGNNDTASDVPVLIDTAEITTSEGKGSVTLSKLPEGWYEIHEKNAGSSWTVRWLNDEGASGGNRIIRLDSENRTKAVLDAGDGVIADGKDINAVVVYNDLKPSIRTSLTDVSLNDHVVPYSDTVVLEDVVAYTGLMPGHYVISGVLVDKNTGEEILDGDGNGITGSVSFDVFKVIDEFGGIIPRSGTVKVTYTLDTTRVNDVTAVAFEELHRTSAGGELIASHRNINDVDQTVYIPGIRTEFLDPETKSHVSASSRTVVLEDTVSYSNLMPGKEYTLSGELIDKTTGRTLDIKTDKTFTPESSSGEETVEFTVDTSVIKGTSVVAFEILKYGDTAVAVHADIDDQDQTVSIPEIKTSLKDSETGDKVAALNTIETLIDTVTYTDLIPGREYTVEGTLIDKGTGEPLGITGTASFTATEPDGSIDVEFRFDSTVLAGKTIVAFETLKYEDMIIAVHADINDRDQTVYVPGIRTTFVDRKTKDHISACSGKEALVDTVSYENLVKGKEYTVTGTLIDKKTGRPFTDGEGNGFTVTKTFTAKHKNGTVDIVFKVDTSVLNGVTIVAFEKMYHNDVLIAAHTDIGDEDQTLNIPKIRTTLKDTVTGEHVASEETVTLVDTVRYTSLIPGREYTVTGILVDRETGKKIVDENGNEITSSVSFAAERPDGSVDIVFNFSSGVLKGKTVVAFEDLYYGEIKVAVHADINDEEQTVYFPEIHTTLTDMTTDKHVAAQGGKVKLKDTVSYSDVKTGCSYVMRGTLYVSSTKEILTDAEGNPVTAFTEFIPNAGSGSVDLVFEFDASLLKGESLVAFEELYYKEHVVAVHNDINDRGQTVDIPDIHTTFFDSAFGAESDLAKCDTEVVLTDRVFYRNLTPGLEYKLYMSIIVKDTGEPFTDKDGNPVTAEKTFVPETLEGFVDVSVTADVTAIEGKSIVAFEALDHDGITLVIHADIEDKDQTMDIPKIRTLAADADNKTHTLTYKEKVTIEDKISYENLVVGKTYKITGTIFNKETGEVYMDGEGRSYVAEKEFTAVNSDGTETVVFMDVLVPFSKIELVISEELTEMETGIRLAAHSDLTDEDQTVRRPVVSTTATVLNSKEIWLESTAVVDITVSDRVSYEGFEPGRRYRAEATLYKTDGTQIMSGGQPLLNIVEFVPSYADGEIMINTVFSSEGMAEGDRVVVFEKFYDIATEEEITAGFRTRDIMISRHEDLENDLQTVTVHYRPMTGGIVPAYSTAGTVLASVASITAFAWFVISRKKNGSGD